MGQKLLSNTNLYGATTQMATVDIFRCETFKPHTIKEKSTSDFRLPLRPKRIWLSSEMLRREVWKVITDVSGDITASFFKETSQIIALTMEEVSTS